MRSRVIRAVGALAIALLAGGVGYNAGNSSTAPAAVGNSGATLPAPAANSIRVLYSLDAKQNDKEIISLIDAAHSHIYFAIYEFTLRDVADALVAAKKRGIEVRGLVDAGESANSYDKPIIDELTAAGIPIETEKHADGNGIMHIKAIVTDQAYALGSYNWTGSATSENDELLEIGTDPALRQTYESILLRLLEKYKGNAAASAAASVSGGTYDYTEASAHIGEYASVRGTLVDAYTSKSGTVFLDFCKSYKACPFSAVIFADDVAKFKNLSSYEGQVITVTGKITSYQNQPEIVLSDPNQIAK